MKYCFLICSLFLVSCGSPLDEGYWKEHNRVADLNSDDGTARSFSIDFESLHQNIDITFSGESFSRDADQKISISVAINYPAGVNVTDFQIRNDACPTATDFYNIPNASAQTTFSRSGIELSTVSTDLNRNLEDQYIYLRGTVSSGTGTIDIACSQIRL